MAISWGSYNGHLRVGIDYTVSPSSPSHSDTSVTVTWKFYLGTDGWNFSGDTSTLHESADGHANVDTTFTNNLTSGDMLVDTFTQTYGISYNSGSKSASANLSGAYNGASPSHSRTINLPDRPVAAPSNGENPSAGSITSSGATFSWSPPSDDGGATVDKYELQLSTGSAFSSTVYDNATLTGLTGHSVTGLNPNTRYYFRVRAHNSAGWGDWTSSNYNFTTLSGLPSTPGVPTATFTSQTAITVGWAASNSNGGTGLVYEVDIATNSTFTTGLVTHTGLTATSYAFTGLTAGTTYYFRVKATNSNGSSSFTSTYSHATQSTSTYTDTGDFVTLVDNLANAVATKMIHLGTFISRGKTGSTSVPNTGITYFDPGTSVETCTLPDPPTYSSNSTSTGSITIQYPGTYLIEFALGVPGNSTTQAWAMRIYVNTHDAPSSTNGGKAGMAGASPWNSNVHGDAQWVSCVRRLAVGDTIAFGAAQTTSAAVSTQTFGDGDLTMFCRVTMIGF